MEKKFKLGVIGGGFMSSAIVGGIVSSKIIDSKDIIVSDINEESLKKFKDINVNTTMDNSYLADNSEFLLFAVKPQNFASVASEIKNPKKIISIMAGVKIATIKKYFYNSMVARCMPNTPCLVKSGAVGIDLNDYKTQADRDFIKNIFSSFAVVVELSEDKLNAVTGISGSSPAYFYLFAKSIIEAGVENGLSYEDAKNLVVNTMIGSGKMIQLNENKSLDELITAVCSKGGTTIEAIKVFNDNGLSATTKKAVDACINRSKELENL